VTRSFRRAAVLAAVVVAGALLSPAPAQAAAQSVTIDRIDTTAPPASGQTVSGTTQIFISSQTTPNDSVARVDLYADPNGVASAVPVASDTTCSIDTCSSQLAWDATGLTGSYTLRVVMTATSTDTASTTASVTVSSPAPTATVTSPTTGATVSRLVTVGVRGRVDNSQNDYPTSVDLTVDGTVVGTFPCPTTNRTCNGSVDWDSTAAAASVTFGAVVHTNKGLTAASSASGGNATVTVSNPGPSVSITSPVDAATVSGTVVVDVSATTDNGLTDLPTTLVLLADGVQVDSRSCVAVHVDPHDCSQPLAWDATGLTGSHTLVARLTTSKTPGTTDSPTVTVSVTTPSAVVVVTGPAAGTVPLGAGATSTSSGIVQVPVSVSTDPGQNDYPDTVELLVNAVVVGSATCPTKVHDCNLSIAWDARKAAGASDIFARMTSTRSVLSTSTTVTVYARSGSRMTVLRPPTVNYLGVATVRGKVTATNTGAGAAGVLVRIVRVPVIGKPAVVYVRTGITGTFTYRFKAGSNTVVSAAVGGGWIGASKGAQHQTVRAPIVCTAVSSVRVNAVGSGRCVVRYLPVGTVVSLRYYFGGRWWTLATGRSRSSLIQFSFSFPRRGTYFIRVTVGTSRVYVATSGRLLKVVVG
jgi:hypothetical protein